MAADPFDAERTGVQTVLHVIPSLDPQGGGPQEGLRQLAVSMRALGVESRVLTADDPGAPWLEAFPAPAVGAGPHRSGYWYAPGMVPWLRAHARRHAAVVVHGLWQYHGLATWRAVRASGVPYAVFPHGMLDPWFKQAYPAKHLKKWLYWRAVERRLLRDAAAVLFTCEEEQRLAPAAFPDIRMNPVVVGFGIAEPPAEGDPARAAFLARFPQLENRRILLFLSRLHPKKGCDLLIRAFAAAAPGDERLRLVMAGPDQGVRAGLEELAATLGVADRVVWAGMLAGPEKWGALHAAEAFVLPSHQENFGVAVVEALACGTPVLISDQVQIWREIEADAAGFVAPDTEQGTRVLLERWLALSPTERTAMEGRARPCFHNHFHVDAAARRLVDALARHAGLAAGSGIRSDAVPA